MIYLAQPYFSNQTYTVEFRVNVAISLAAYLMSKGFVVFSPVAYSAQLKNSEFLTALDNDEWVNFDLELLRKADLFLFVGLPGWGKSAGMKREIEFVIANKIPFLLHEWYSYGNKSTETNGQEIIDRMKLMKLINPLTYKVRGN